MPLLSNDKTYSYFLECPHLLMDTCALTWFTRHENGFELFHKVMQHYLILIPTPVLYEFAFGDQDQSSESERDLRTFLFKTEHKVEMFSYAMTQQQRNIRPGTFYVINPGFNEWWTARDRLLIYANLSKASTRKVKRELSMDALIHACARNCFAPICTVNVSDFKKLNLAANSRSHDRGVPFFTPEEVLASITEPVLFCQE